MNKETDAVRREVSVDIELKSLREDIDEIKGWFLWLVRTAAGIVCAMAYLYLQTKGLVP